MCDPLVEAQKRLLVRALGCGGEGIVASAHGKRFSLDVGGTGIVIEGLDVESALAGVAASAKIDLVERRFALSELGRKVAGEIPKEVS